MHTVLDAPPPQDLTDDQAQFLAELRAGLDRLRPAHLDEQASGAALTEDGTLHVVLAHRTLPDVAVQAWVSAKSVTVGVEPVIESIGGRAGSRDPERRRRAAVGFTAALISGFEREITLRDGQPVRVVLRVPGSDGRPHRFTGRLRGPRFGPKEVVREQITFLR
ncbi:MAG: hypothetical protein ACR2NA_07720 [Solirubrobacterales bacterium]